MTDCLHTATDTDSAAMAESIRSAYRSADADALAGGLSWYTDATDMIRDDADAYGLPFSTVAAIYSACSINATWAANVTIARKWLAYATGKAVRPGGLSTVIVRAEAAVSSRPETFEDAWSVVLQGADERGSKVASFVSNFHGRTDYVTIDRWAMVGAGCAATIPHPRKRDTVATCKHANAPKGLKYARIADAYRDVAAELGIAPRELQAAVWVAVRGSAN